MAKLPDYIEVHAKNLAKNYSESPATTNAGFILRLIVKFLPIDLICKALTEKVLK